MRLSVHQGTAPFYTAYVSPQSLALPRFDRQTMNGLVRVGSSSMVEAVCLRIGFLILARLIAYIGTNAFAAYQIVGQVTSLSFTLRDGVSTAATSLVGQSLGAKRKDLAKGYAQVASRLGFIVAVLLMLVIFGFIRQLAMLFTRDEEIIHAVASPERCKRFMIQKTPYPCLDKALTLKVDSSLKCA